MSWCISYSYYAYLAKEVLNLIFKGAAKIMYEKLDELDQAKKSYLNELNEQGKTILKEIFLKFLDDHPILHCLHWEQYSAFDDFTHDKPTGFVIDTFFILFKEGTTEDVIQENMTPYFWKMYLEKKYNLKDIIHSRDKTYHYSGGISNYFLQPGTKLSDDLIELEDQIRKRSELLKYSYGDGVLVICERSGVSVRKTEW